MNSRIMAVRPDVRAHHALLAAIESVEGSLARAASSKGSSFHWVWVLVAGVMVLGAGAGMYYCQQKGYDGFTGDWKYHKDASGVTVGIDVACYKK